MFHSNEAKTKIAVTILRECKNALESELFLQRCCDAGITHGNRDTQDELWEFEEYVLSGVPGAIHAFRDSLIYELRQDDPKWKYSVILDALIRSGNYKTSEALFSITEEMLDRNARMTNEKINSVYREHAPRSPEYANGLYSALLGNDLFRARLAHATAFRYMHENQRLDQLWGISVIAADARTYENNAFWYQAQRFFNTQIGLFGLDRHLVETPRRGQWLYRYRIGTWAALAEWIVRNTPYNELGKFWDKSLAHTLVINTTDRLLLPESKEFISDNKADWEYIARVVPGFYRQYNEAKAKLAKYK